MLVQRPWQRLSISLTTSRHTFTRSATCTVLHLVFWTLLPPLPTLRCTTSPLDFEAQPLSSSPDLLGNFLTQGDRKLSKTRSPDSILHNLHDPFRHLLFSLTLCRQFAECVELSCVLSLPCIVLQLPCLCESSFVSFSFSHPNTQLQLQQLPLFGLVKLPLFGLVKLPLFGLVKLPLLGLVKLPLFGLLTSAYTLLHGFLSPTPARTSTLFDT
jgi:hypothetical protein